jgi:thiol-disulfide isomerase/thioredoxin
MVAHTFEGKRLLGTRQYTRFGRKSKSMKGTTVRNLVHVFVVLFCLAGCGVWGGTAQDPDVTGWVDAKSILRPDFAGFRARYDTVEVNVDLARMIGQLQTGVETLVFFGPWCSDSKREVPHFIKIAEQAGMPTAAIRYYALDRTKESADGLTARHRIERVPTFIFFRDGKEIGRIVELPRSTLEGDIYEILVADAKKRGQAG